MSGFPTLNHLDESSYQHTIMLGILYGAGFGASGLLVYILGSAMICNIDDEVLNKLVMRRNLVALSIVVTTFGLMGGLCISERFMQHNDLLSIVTMCWSILAGLFISVWGGINSYAAAVWVRNSLVVNPRELERRYHHRRHLESDPIAPRADQSAHAGGPYRELSPGPITSSVANGGTSWRPARDLSDATPPRSQPRRSSRRTSPGRSDA